MTKVIVAQWVDGRVECYSTLTVFLEYFPGRSYETIMYHLSRNNRPYSDNEVTLHRCTVTRAGGGVKTKTHKINFDRKLRQFQSGRVGCVHNTLKYIGPWYSCETCGTHFDARAEAPSEGALDF